MRNENDRNNISGFGLNVSSGGDNLLRYEVNAGCFSGHFGWQNSIVNRGRGWRAVGKECLINLF